MKVKLGVLYLALVFGWARKSGSWCIFLCASESLERAKYTSERVRIRYVCAVTDNDRVGRPSDGHSEHDGCGACWFRNATHLTVASGLIYARYTFHWGGTPIGAYDKTRWPMYSLIFTGCTSYLIMVATNGLP